MQTIYIFVYEKQKRSCRRKQNSYVNEKKKKKHADETKMLMPTKIKKAHANNKNPTYT